MKIKGYVVDELPDSCGECQFLEVMMEDDETWYFIAGTRLTKRRRLSGRTTEPQQEPRDGYQRLAAAAIAQALTDAQLGDWGALLWLLSDNCQMYTEWIGTDYNRIKQAANIIRGKPIAGAQEKD